MRPPAAAQAPASPSRRQPAASGCALDFRQEHAGHFVKTRRGGAGRRATDENAALCPQSLLHSRRMICCCRCTHLQTRSCSGDSSAASTAIAASLACCPAASPMPPAAASAGSSCMLSCIATAVASGSGRGAQCALRIATQSAWCSLCQPSSRAAGPSALLLTFPEAARIIVCQPDGCTQHPAQR